MQLCTKDLTVGEEVEGTKEEGLSHRRRKGLATKG